MPTYSDKTSQTLKQPFLLEFNQLGLNFGKLNVLENISFKLNQGDFLYIIGPNGAGKSSLLNILTGLIKQSSGHFKLYTETVGFLPQMPNTKVNFPITVNEVIYSGFNKQNLFISKKDQSLINDWLLKMDIADLGNKQMSYLSGGQRQRVFLIRALISNPELLILDEPTSALDIHFRDRFYDLLRTLNQSGTTIIFVTHDLSGHVKDTDVLMHIDQHIHFFGPYKQYKNEVGVDHHV